MNPYPGSIGAFGGLTAIVTVIPVLTASSAYSSGNSIGGKFTLANAVQIEAGTSFLHHIKIFDRSNTKPSGNILIFDQNPLAATLTDKTAFVYSTDDFNQIARIPVAAADYSTINSKASADFPNLGRFVKAASGTTLYAAFISDGVSLPTFLTTSDLKLSFKFAPQAN